VSVFEAVSTVEVSTDSSGDFIEGLNEAKGHIPDWNYLITTNMPSLTSRTSLSRPLVRLPFGLAEHVDD
jgi:hypothetical protein